MIQHLFPKLYNDRKRLVAIDVLKARSLIESIKLSIQNQLFIKNFIIVKLLMKHCETFWIKPNQNQLRRSTD